MQIKLLAVAAAILAIAATAQAQPSRDAPPGLTPPPGVANGQPFQTGVPDGQFFIDTDEGGARHAASGFVCPAQVAGRRRDRLLIFDTAQNGRDVACGYGTQTESSWYTFYLTKIPGMSGAKVWDAYERDARTAAPPKGSFDPPLAPGRDPPAPRYASFWRNARGGIDGLWLTQIGDWHIKLRATFHEQDAAEAKAMAEALYKAIYEQMRAPAV
jgi:hypothetical protein